MESERIFIELSSLSLSRLRFLQAVGNQFKLLSGCDALEIRAFDADLQYRWHTDFGNTAKFEEVQFQTDAEGNSIPILPEGKGLEEICKDLFRKRYEPFLQYEYSLNSRYIDDAGLGVKLKDKGGEKLVRLDGAGFASALLLPFSVPENPPGLLLLYSKTKNFLEPHDIPSYEELMSSFSIALKFRRSLYALNERIKELSCLYDIGQIYQEGSDEPETLLSKIIDHIPRAFQFPESASALLSAGKLEYASANLAVTHNKLESGIILNGEKLGTLSVFYPTPESSAEPMHFLQEEQKLLDIIAQKVSLIYERIRHKQDRLAMEEQLRHADRLATVGQLGSGIAHELNDPLANILGYAQLLLKTVKEPAQVADLERIVRSSLQAREIVRKLLLFARQMPTQKSEVSLNKVITDTLDLLKSRLEQGRVILQTELSPELPSFLADASQLSQVVTNLCVNALQAMPQGGKLLVSTSYQNGIIQLEVTDSGNGIPSEELDKIFLPFYTTKPVGVGTGLGLSVVHGIIDSHQGNIAVQSKPGKGTRFTVSLPAKPKSERKGKAK